MMKIKTNLLFSAVSISVKKKSKKSQKNRNTFFGGFKDDEAVRNFKS